jgi:hypothetical protein
MTKGPKSQRGRFRASVFGISGFGILNHRGLLKIDFNREGHEERKERK